MSDSQAADLNESEIYWWQPIDAESRTDTRSAILVAAYKEIHLNGFQSASLNNILAHTGVTKGALYHHFPNKTELGYAVVDEVIAKHIARSFIQPLEQAEDGIAALIDLLRHSGDAFTLRDIELGCPLSVLAIACCNCCSSLAVLRWMNFCGLSAWQSKQSICTEAYS